MSGTQTNTGETMHLAVERFRTQMESANRQFIQDRIDEIEAKNLSTEKEKLDLMRYYWHDLGEKQSGTWLDDAPRDIARRVRETENVSRLEDMKTIFHEHMDGIIPSTLVTDEWRQMFLDIVESVCNEAAEQDDEDENFLIPRCDELGHFIKYANGVQDPDLRRSGICPFDPVPYFGIGDLTSPDGSTVQPQPPTAEFRERIKEQLKDDILGDSFISGAVDEDLEVKVGFQTGLGCHREYDTWYSAYLYCRRDIDDDDSDRSHKDWAWRVVVFHADAVEPTPLYGRKPIFDSIPEFLVWYSSWLNHLDLDQVRKDVRCLYGDDDHDSGDDDLWMIYVAWLFVHCWVQLICWQC